jgi:signal transduction histidine kinase
MPKMDGITLLSTLKVEPEFAWIPFIFLTGNASTSDRRKGMQLGADDYLTKPFTSDELIASVETRLSKKNTQQKYYESQFEDIKSNFIYALPHEFRTPLNGILGFSQILMEEQNIPADEIKELGSRINKSGQRLHHLLENLIMFGQLQLWIHDQQKIIELQSTSTLIIEVIRMASEKLMKKYGRTDAVRLSLKDCITQISSVLLTKIVSEIIDNALKFSETGAFVSVSSEECGSNIHIVVQDVGRGISEEQIKKITGFQQFERGYYEQQGAGLGLAIAKTLTELHGGDLLINSNGMKGTTVTISLPKAIQH